MLLCLHEDHAVAIAHGYAKATGEPMACVLHSNVGLLHGHDEPLQRLVRPRADDRARRDRPGRCRRSAGRGSTGSTPAKDQGGLLRNFIKWDDEPRSAGARGDHVPRRYA